MNKFKSIVFLSLLCSQVGFSSQDVESMADIRVVTENDIYIEVNALKEGEISILQCLNDKTPPHYKEIFSKQIEIRYIIFPSDLAALDILKDKLAERRVYLTGFVERALNRELDKINIELPKLLQIGKEQLHAEVSDKIREPQAYLAAGEPFSMERINQFRMGPIGEVIKLLRKEIYENVNLPIYEDSE